VYGSDYEDHRSLEEKGGTHSTITFNDTWQLKANQLDWSRQTTTTKDGNGSYTNFAQQKESHPPFAGHTPYYVSSYTLHEEFDWSSVTVEFQQSESGAVSGGSMTIGLENGFGTLVGHWEGCIEIPPGFWDKSGLDTRDEYKGTAVWLQSSGVDGSQSYDALVINDVNGRLEAFTVWLNPIPTPDPPIELPPEQDYPPETYQEQLSSMGFCSPSYYTTYFGANLPSRYLHGGLPITETGSYFIPGQSSGSSGEEDSGDSETLPDPLAGGPWFRVADSTSTSSSDSLIVGLNVGMLTVISGSSQQAVKDSVILPEGPSYLEMALDWGVDKIRQIVGDENLVNATDTQLLLGTAGVVSVTVVGAWLAPATVAGGAVAGVAYGVASNIAQQLDSGATWNTLSISQIADAGITGGIVGGVMGMAGGIVGGVTKVIPGGCIAIKAVAGFGAVQTFSSSYDSFNRGNYWSAGVELGAGIICLADMAKASCFVAGTQVVRYVVAPSLITANDTSQPGEDRPEGWNAPYLVLAAATLSVGLASSGRKEKKRRRRRDDAREIHNLLFGQDDWNDDPLDDLPSTRLKEGSSSDTAWQAQIDELCESLFNSAVVDGEISLSDGGMGATGVPPVPLNGGLPSRPQASPACSTIPTAVPTAKPALRESRSRMPDTSSASQTLAGCQWHSTKTVVGGQLRSLLLALSLIASSLFFFRGMPSTWWSSVPPSPPPVTLAAGGSTPEYVTTSIEDLRVGDWVLAQNPEVSDAEREAAEPIEPDLWRKLTLRMQKPDGGRLDIELLRPAAWLEEIEAEPGAILDVDLPELGAEGEAEILAVESCPPIDAPPSPDCRVVTGRFCHASAEVLDLRVTGLPEPIGVTANHPFWSEDRQAFLPASHLHPGERLRTADDQLCSVVSLRPAPAQAVYNIEVDLEHVYFVSTSGILVHNACGKKDKAEAPSSAVTATPRSAAARSQYLRSLADDHRTPSWMKPWLREGKVPPGHQVDHIKPLSIGDPDTPANIRLQGTDLHRTHHRFYRPWE
jgi:hypothetical protein